MEQSGTAHDHFALDRLLGRGMKLNLFRDTVATVSGASAMPTVTTDFLHFETDRSKPNNLLAEEKRVDGSDGKFEHTSTLDLNYRANKAMTLRFNRLAIDRGKDPSSDTDLIEWKWQMNKALNFCGQLANTTTNNDTNSILKSFAMTGPVTKTLNVTGTYTEVNSKQNVKAVSDVALSTAKPIKALGLKDVTFTGKYAATNDQHKEQSQGISPRWRVWRAGTRSAWSTGAPSSRTARALLPGRS